MRQFEIYCEWDNEARVWYVVRSDVPGLNAEAATCEEMSKLLAHLVPELVQLNMPEDREPKVPLELLVHADKRLTVRCN